MLHFPFYYFTKQHKSLKENPWGWHGGWQCRLSFCEMSTSGGHWLQTQLPCFWPSPVLMSPRKQQKMAKNLALVPMRGTQKQHHALGISLVQSQLLHLWEVNQLRKISVSLSSAFQINHKMNLQRKLV